MAEGIIKTGVDDLLELLKKIEKISIQEAADRLEVSPTVLQLWVDFLVEEEIVGVEYKFTKPIIYLNKPPESKKAKVKEEPELGLDTFKEDFKMRADQRNIPQERLSFLWKNHVRMALTRRRDLFIREAKKRNLSNTEELWNAYNDKLMAEDITR